ncbi:unnamed protein product [Linum tenue]|uniref:Beta-Casp domain-containing protein n=1 Tax=Linum tenue TaxID=586396 RepID=A0AAV0JKQ1_9ROSI|nr:unnamed protein product [Linum tenue]
MKLTCLSSGSGYQFPPCHILEDVCGFRILLDCPLDLSALSVFSPVPPDNDFVSDGKASYNSARDCFAKEQEIQKRQKIETPLHAKDLIHDELWYKTVKNLHLWDPSSIDVVLISSVMGMLGLPFLTRAEGFSAKIYVTDAAARLARLMMEDLIAMNMEYQYFYGPRESGGPHWMRWEELELLRPELKKVVVGKDGTELGGWLPLYSSADVMDCMRKVQTLKYAETACYNGTLVLQPFSSGSEIGSCNWTIDGPKRNITWLSCSIFASAHAMNFDYGALRGRDLVLYSDKQFLPLMDEVQSNDASSTIPSNDLSSLRCCSADKDDWKKLTESLLSTDEILEKEKMDFICSCILQSVQAGGSVVIPYNRLGILLQLLEMIPVLLESLAADVPIYVISSMAAELLAFTNVIPEWASKPRQEKAYLFGLSIPSSKFELHFEVSKVSSSFWMFLQMFSGEPMFSHVDFVNKRKLHVFSAIHSPELLTTWQEPCIIFAPHWSLRLGPVVHLLRRWSGDENSLLILEDGVDPDIALLPFKPLEMKVLQCSFLPERRLPKVDCMLKLLQPKILVLPDDLKEKLDFSNPSLDSFSVLYYTEGETLSLPSSPEGTLDLEIASVLAERFAWQNLGRQDVMYTRLEGELVMEQGKFRLLPGITSADSHPSKNKEMKSDAG